MVGQGPQADAIVVAAGAASRMDGVDKLLVTLGDRPLLAHAIGALTGVSAIGSIVIVTTPERRRALERGAWWSGERITFTEGGPRRQDSVRAGFLALERAVPDPEGRRVVLVHDGARPIVAPALIEALIAATERHGAAIPVVPVVDTLKQLVEDRVEATVERSGLAAAQTPQGVRRGILREALAGPAAGDGTWTDEAALLEASRIDVHVVPGDPANLKVTVPADLARVSALLAGSRPSRRTGIGHDAHPFGPGRPLRLGGIDIPGAPRLHGHSDGDVALHAVADALLGAAGLGDLGRMFPAGPETPSGIDSRALLGSVIARLAEAGWRPAGVDLTITAARPRLADHLGAMRAAIAATLAIDGALVSVKASTGNLDGGEGAGRSISTLALVTIEGTA